MNSRESSVNIVSLFVLTIILRFLRTLSITLTFDERCICFSRKMKNNSPHKYIDYSVT